ncbi:MAG TPA: ATP synthase F1 subunit epsilon [Candidatus Saccharimonadales bacterium]|nr:ATP synthase F1 subunit epsilon [Candidatus Saccharimonadales bacterium]
MFHLLLVTLTGIKFEGDVYEVILPTLDGEIGILRNHMPLISVATSGVVAVKKNRTDSENQREFFAISGGVIEVEHNQLKVIVDEADHADNINEAEAEAAHERARTMKAEAKDQVSLEHAQAMVDRTGARLEVAKLKRRHQR